MSNNVYDNERYVNPNTNYTTLMNELKYRISNLELDLVHINDPELKGIAQRLHTDLTIQYFKLMKDDLELQKMYEYEEYDEYDEDGVIG